MIQSQEILYDSRYGNHALHKYPRVNSTEEIDRFMRSVKHESYYAEKKEK